MAPLRYVGRAFRYAGAPPRYAAGPCRYAAPTFRYAAAGVRYAATRLRYAGPAFRYAAAPPRYARARFRYAAAGLGVKDAGWAADITGMMRPLPPTSNVERQRLFRLRHPGYYARVNARRRAGHKAAVQLSLAAARALAVGREPLLLPAPVKLLEIPGINAIPAAMPVRTAVPVS